MSLTKINPGNKALIFLEKRIKDDKYRGSWSSQHNRYTMQQIVDILKLLDKYAPNKTLMRIRTTDISKRPYNLPEEEDYAKFCNDAKGKAGIGTQDAMRKNLFVDIHRMGLINRYDKDKIPVDPFSRSQVMFVSLTDFGLRLINAKNLTDKYFMFSKGIDILLGGHIDIILNILRDKEYNLDYVNFYEYMFFISAIGTKTSFSINEDEAVDLIKEYRKLTSIQRKSVVEYLKEYMNPRNFKGNKINKRDFHNWKNKIDQIFYLLNQTVYFEIRGEKLLLRQDKANKELSELFSIKKLNRSLNEKYLYFKNHGINKIKGFELHHVIPLSWSESVFHFKLLDNWKNLVYIDAFSHAKITQNRNRNVVLELKDNDIILKDFSNNSVYLYYKKNINYNPKYKNDMKKYNYELLNTIKI